MTADQARTQRVVIADDDPLVRVGLRSLLEPVAGITVVAEASDRVAAIAALQATGADVLLMDVHMPGMNGIAATPVIRSRFPRVRIVLMTNFDAARAEPHARVAGAHDFVRKSASLPRLVAAIRGEPAADVEMPAAGWPALSRREREVARRVAEGQSNDQIAAALSVSVNTAKTYVSRLFRKLGIDNRVHVANAVNAGLLGRVVPPPTDDG